MNAECLITKYEMGFQLMEKDQKFQVGNVVRSNSGAREMTVIKYVTQKRVGEPKQVICRWETVTGFADETFPEQALRLIRRN